MNDYVYNTKPCCQKFDTCNEACHPLAMALRSRLSDAAQQAHDHYQPQIEQGIKEINAISAYAERLRAAAQALVTVLDDNAVAAFAWKQNAYRDLCAAHDGLRDVLKNPAAPSPSGEDVRGATVQSGAPSAGCDDEILTQEQFDHVLHCMANPKPLSPEARARMHAGVTKLRALLGWHADGCPTVQTNGRGAKGDEPDSEQESSGLAARIVEAPAQPLAAGKDRQPLNAECVVEKQRAIARKHALNAVAPIGSRHSRSDPVVMQNVQRQEEIIFYAIKESASVEWFANADGRVESPAYDGPGTAGGGGQSPAPCPEAEKMGEFACANRHQCWEPCGELGHSEAHVRVAPPEASAAVDAALGLPPKKHIEEPK